VGNSFIIDNEFGGAHVSRDDRGNSPRLRITDLRSGKSILLDALELETLAWVRHDELAPLLDPSASRWQDGPDDGDGRLLPDAVVPRSGQATEVADR
jgi:hypothetical protein